MKPPKPHVEAAVRQATAVLRQVWPVGSVEVRLGNPGRNLEAWATPKVIMLRPASAKTMIAALVHEWAHVALWQTGSDSIRHGPDWRALEQQIRRAYEAATMHTIACDLGSRRCGVRMTSTPAERVDRAATKISHAVTTADQRVHFGAVETVLRHAPAELLARYHAASDDLEVYRATMDIAHAVTRADPRLHFGAVEIVLRNAPPEVLREYYESRQAAERQERRPRVAQGAIS